MKIDLEIGVWEGIECICEVYGFILCNQFVCYFGIINSFFGSWILRNNFFFDIVLRCFFEMGVLLFWFVIGDGVMFDYVFSDIVRIFLFKFDNLKLVKILFLMFDKVMIFDYIGDFEIIVEGNVKYLVDKVNYVVVEGKYLIEYLGIQSIKELFFFFGNKL